MILSASLIAFPDIDPVIFELGPIVIRWYALAYITGVFGGWWIVKKIDQQSITPLLSPKALDDIIIYAILGIVLGGRIGFVLFYNLPFYLDNPLQALKIWQGGMSFHGGLLGVIIAFYLFARRFKISFLKLMDMIAAVAPLGILLGRLANFINGELWGRPTDVAWAMKFPTGGDIARHPSQLYEAGLEGLTLFILLLCLALFTKIRNYPSMLGGMFLVGYGSARAFVEQFRQPDEELGFLWDFITMGQLLSLPMIAVGLGFIIFAWRRGSKHVVA